MWPAVFCLWEKKNKKNKKNNAFDNNAKQGTAVVTAELT